MSIYLKLIRVKHWLKNGLIFLPLFFSISLFDSKSFFTCLIAFLTFSFAASVVYVLNDLKDIDKDRKHPVKKNRPLASGAVSKKQAYFVIAALVLIFLALSVYLFSLNNNVFTFVIPFIYVFLNIFYSF